MVDAQADAGALDRILNVFPTLNRDQRRDLYERIGSGADGGVDFVVMMVLSATLASVGLLQGSTAVVIGAMLVAPLMGPLVAAGLAVVQGNLRLMRSSMVVTLGGVLIGLAVSLFFGFINPGFEASMEIEARGNPDFFDLVVALASGMVAAYAQGRPNVSGTLAGVAIAAALVPPLAVVGLAFMGGRPGIALNAAVLLTTNLVAIILGAAMVFRALGVHLKKRESGMPSWVRRTVLTLIMLAIILMAPLVLTGVEKMRLGQIRPTSYPVSREVYAAIEEFISRQPSMVLINAARLSSEPDSDVTIVLSTLDAVPRTFRDDLTNLVLETRGYSLLADLVDSKTEVRIFIMQEAPILVE